MSETAALSARDLYLELPGDGGPVPVLDGVDLDVQRGELVAIIGPSGCGKSTLLSTLAGLLEPDDGDVLLDGHRAASRLGLISLMPQTDALLPWRTLRENIALGGELRGLSRAGARQRAAELISAYGLTGHEHHYPHALSGGLRQRAALARALEAGNSVWLLDEPFGALDALTRAALHRELLAAWSRHRPTVLLVTHDLDEALLLASRVLVCGPRPTRVVAELDVDLPYPRAAGTTTTPAFADLKRRLLAALGRAGAMA